MNEETRSLFARAVHPQAKPFEQQSAIFHILTPLLSTELPEVADLGLWCSVLSELMTHPTLETVACQTLAAVILLLHRIAQSFRERPHEGYYWFLCAELGLLTERLTQACPRSPSSLVHAYFMRFFVEVFIALEVHRKPLPVACWGQTCLQGAYHVDLWPQFERFTAAIIPPPRTKYIPDTAIATPLSASKILEKLNEYARSGGGTNHHHPEWLEPNDRDKAVELAKKGTFRTIALWNLWCAVRLRPQPSRDVFVSLLEDIAKEVVEVDECALKRCTETFGGEFWRLCLSFAWEALGIVAAAAMFWSLRVCDDTSQDWSWIPTERRNNLKMLLANIGMPKWANDADEFIKVAKGEAGKTVWR